MSKKPSRKRLHSTTAPHRRQLPREKVSTTNTTTTHPHGKYRYPRIHSHIFLYDPRILVGIFAYLNSLLLLDSCRPVKSTLAPILFFPLHRHARAHTLLLALLFLSRNLNTPHHTTTSPHGLSRKKNKRKKSAQRASLSAPRVCSVGHPVFFSLWSLWSLVSPVTHTRTCLSLTAKRTPDLTRLDSTLAG